MGAPRPAGSPVRAPDILKGPDNHLYTPSPGCNHASIFGLPAQTGVNTSSLLEAMMSIRASTCCNCCQVEIKWYLFWRLGGESFRGVSLRAHTHTQIPFHLIYAFRLTCAMQQIPRVPANFSNCMRLLSVNMRKLFSSLVF